MNQTELEKMSFGFLKDWYLQRVGKMNTLEKQKVETNLSCTMQRIGYSCNDATDFAKQLINKVAQEKKAEETVE